MKRTLVYVVLGVAALAFTFSLGWSLGTSDGSDRAMRMEAESRRLYEVSRAYTAADGELEGTVLYRPVTTARAD